MLLLLCILLWKFDNLKIFSSSWRYGSGVKVCIVYVGFWIWSSIPEKRRERKKRKNKIRPTKSVTVSKGDCGPTWALGIGGRHRGPLPGSLLLNIPMLLWETSHFLKLVKSSLGHSGQFPFVHGFQSFCSHV